MGKAIRAGRTEATVERTGVGTRAGRMEAAADRTGVGTRAGRMEATEDPTADAVAMQRRRGATVVRAVTTAVRAVVITAVQVGTVLEVRTEEDIAKLD